MNVSHQTTVSRSPLAFSRPLLLLPLGPLCSLSRNNGHRQSFINDKRSVSSGELSSIFGWCFLDSKSGDELMEVVAAVVSVMVGKASADASPSDVMLLMRYFLW